MAVDVVVVGGGFAGVMTAERLVRRGGVKVLLVEQEAVPGFHGTGRNAAIARRLAEHPAVTSLAERSLLAMAERFGPDGSPVLRRTGGVLLGRDAFLDALARTAPRGGPLDGDIQRLSPLEATERWPFLAGADFDGALYTRGCGVVDIHALLQTGLDALRGVVRLKTRLEAVERDRAGQIAAVRVGGERVVTGALINAGGFGAQGVGSLAGARPIPFRPVRRHLFTTAHMDTLAPGSPWFWDVSGGWYLRPEGRGLLLCACDATPWPADGPEDPPRDPAAREVAAARFTDTLPSLSTVAIARDWAGLRILTPDGAFVIGPDPDVRGLFWVAGLGGHGMTTSCGVGAFAADLFLGAEVPGEWVRAFSPARFHDAAP